MNDHYGEGYKERKDYELVEILEGLIDRHGLDDVVSMIGGVCEGKAHFLASVWREIEESMWWSEKASKLWNL